MKVIKLTLIFASILGCVVAAFFLIPDKPKTKLPPIKNSTYETYRQQFEKDWQQKGDWNTNLFNSHCDIVNQLSSKYETRPLKDFNTGTAVRIVFRRIFEEWRSSSCHKEIVDEYMKAIEIIEGTDVNAKTNTKVALIKKVYSTYKTAYNLANKKIGLTPQFDGITWNSYKNYRNSIMSHRNSVIGNADYKQYLSNISAIRNAMISIPGKLDSAERRFYQSLSYSIKNYYEDIPSNERNRHQLNNLRSVRNRYEEEYSSNTSLNILAKDFLYDVEKNENNSNR